MTFPFPFFIPQLQAPPAFPVVEATTTGATSTNPGVHSLPSGIQAGDLLLVFFRINNVTITVPSGWTTLLNTLTGGNPARCVVIYRIADGSETTVSISMSATTAQRSIAYRISTYQGVPELASASGLSSGASINPPNLSPTWGSAKNLWLIGGWSVTDNGVSGTPANYSGTITNFFQTSQRELEAASENPGNYTNFANVNWVAVTVAIQGT